MQVEASRGPIEELDVQALAVAVFKNEKTVIGFLILENGNRQSLHVKLLNRSPVGFN